MITHERAVDEGWVPALRGSPDWREHPINGTWVHVQVANDPTNVRTKPCDVGKRPFDQVATGQGVENAAVFRGLSRPATVYSSDELKQLRHAEAAAERALPASLYNAEAMAPRVSLAQEIPVTEEMIAAAKAVHIGRDVINNWADFTAIYRAMAAVAPVALVSDAELGVAALEAENAEWRARCHAKTLEIQRDEDDWRAIVDAKDAEIKALRASLTAFTMPPAPEPKPFPAAALKPSKGDPRRVGG